MLVVESPLGAGYGCAGADPGQWCSSHLQCFQFPQQKKGEIVSACLDCQIAKYEQQTLIFSYSRMIYTPRSRYVWVLSPGLIMLAQLLCSHGVLPLWQNFLVTGQSYWITSCSWTTFNLHCLFKSVASKYSHGLRYRRFVPRQVNLGLHSVHHRDQGEVCISQFYVRNPSPSFPMINLLQRPSFKVCTVRVKMELPDSSGNTCHGNLRYTRRENGSTAFLIY